MDAPLIVRIDDVRQEGHCVLGARTWFTARGLSFREFCRNGIDANVLLSTGDALAERAVARARERVSHG